MPSPPSNDHEKSPEKPIAPGQNAGDYGADGNPRPMLSTRHLTMIALGSSIGLGMWLGSGTSLRNGGPAAILIGYFLAGSMAWSVNQGIGEMATLYPLPSAFVQWSNMFVCPSVGFAVGWTCWFATFISIANELQGAATVLHFWTDKVPIAAWITIFWVVIVLVNAWTVKFFGEVEVVSSSIKFGWMFVVVISLIVVSAGGAPNHKATGFEYWNATPFTNGFKGFLSVMPTCIFAVSGTESAAIAASETQNPRKSMPTAVRSIWLRLSLFYILGALAITITVSPQDPNLFGADGDSNSPFVVAYQNAGIPVLAHITNAIILISVLSSGSISSFSGSRILIGLSHLHIAPKIFSYADSRGCPLAGLIITLLGGSLAYLNVSNSGATVFTWLSDLTSLFTLFTWGAISASHLRMRYAWKIQGRADTDLPWRSRSYPYASWWALSWCIILIIVEFYLAVWPLHGTSNVKGFFANYVSVVFIVGVYLGARVWYRGPWWVNLREVDLDRQRRFYGDGD